MKILVLVFALFFGACDNTPPPPTEDVVIDSLSSDSTVAVLPPPMLSKKNPIASLDKLKFRYKLKKYNDEFKLSNQLREVSGIALLEDEKLVYAINDEVGKIYQLST